MRLNYFEWSRAVCQPFNPNQLGLLVKLKLFTLWVGCSLKCDNPVGLAAHWTDTRLPARFISFYLEFLLLISRILLHQ